MITSEEAAAVGEFVERCERLIAEFAATSGSDADRIYPLAKLRAVIDCEIRRISSGGSDR